mgnify:CR=1 FL=1
MSGASDEWLLKEAKSNNEEVLISEMLSQQKIDDLSNNDNDESAACANCGKEGGDNMNTCNKCDLVVYCNVACKKRHRSKHKKDCEMHVAELQQEELERIRQAAKLHNEKLFKQPPPKGDCPICMHRMPTLGSACIYMSCCGKVICSGCCYAPSMITKAIKLIIKRVHFAELQMLLKMRQLKERRNEWIYTIPLQFVIWEFTIEMEETDTQKMIRRH